MNSKTLATADSKVSVSFHPAWWFLPAVLLGASLWIVGTIAAVEWVMGLF